MSDAFRSTMALFLVALTGPASCYVGTGPGEAGDSGVDPIEDPGENLDSVEVIDSADADSAVDPELDASPEPWCGMPSGCMDACCPECENGSTRGIGGCWDTCEGYYNIQMDCDVICHDFTCSISSWDWLSPGCAGSRDMGMCMGYSGKNSFWYLGALAVRVTGDYPEPNCPSDNPCCQPQTCEFGFDVGHDCGGYGFVPLDLSELPDLAWSCTATNCGVEGTPPEGTWVKVHVRWSPSHVEMPETFVLEELCEIL